VCIIGWGFYADHRKPYDERNNETKENV